MLLPPPTPRRPSEFFRSNSLPLRMTSPAETPSFYVLRPQALYMLMPRPRPELADGRRRGTDLPRRLSATIAIPLFGKKHPRPTTTPQQLPIQRVV